MEKIHEGHRSRLKKRFMNEGLDSFEDHEVLELLLFYCIPMKDTNALAHKMISEFGTISGLFEADVMDICKRCKVTENTATLVTLIPSLSRRYQMSKWGEKPRIETSTKAGELALSVFSGRQYEAFFVFSMDIQSRVNNIELVHEGTINEVPIYPRIIVESAIRNYANSIIIAHNHPGGICSPSEADIEATKKIKNALGAISINVRDHIIIAGEKYYSFAENNLI